MIEVVVTDEHGTAIDRAEADTPEDAAYAARVLWDESLTGLVRERRRVRFYVDGRMAWQGDKRP